METVYIETTVVSYLVVKPSQNVIVAAHQQLTREWWQRQRPQFACYVSNVVLNEARRGDPKQATLRLRALEGIANLSGSAEAERLAASFLAHVLPPKALGDAAHLAIATVGQVKYLVT